MRAETRARARRAGVLTRYRTIDGAQQSIDEDVVVAVIEALGEPAPDPLLDPVAVAWDDDRPRLHLGAGAAGTDIDRLHVAVRDADAATTAEETVFAAGDCAVESRDDGRYDLVLPTVLTPGAYTATLVGGALDGAAATILAAPTRLRAPGPRRWGVFAPVWGLHDDDGAADLGALGRLAAWAGSEGAALVATLPLLATFLDAPCDPSPYTPVSRRWWNELYLDLAAVPELAGAPVPATVGGRDLDHCATMAERRRALELGAARLRGDRARAAARFEAERPEVVTYARFRTAVELHGPDPSAWPDRHVVERDAVLDPARERYHRYVQFLLHEQLGSLRDSLRARGQGLYLDLPVGTHPSGFDVHTDPGAFARGATVGAPPDDFFAGGQNWGFRPPHPTGARTEGHRDLRRALACHLEVADVLRLDHVMGLQRLWWIPDGAPATDGAYVQYPMDELFAVVCAAAARHDATVVGEDLGTVSPTVERALARHRVVGMYVGQFAVDPGGDPPLTPPGRRRVAGLDTHDTATFAGFWTAADPATRVALAATLLGRTDGADPGTGPDVQRAVLHAWLAALATGPAETVLVSVEDLWLEPDPQNVPGTTDATHRNWSRRFARATDALDGDPDVAAALAPLRARRSAVPC